MHEWLQQVLGLLLVLGAPPLGAIVIALIVALVVAALALLVVSPWLPIAIPVGVSASPSSGRTRLRRINALVDYLHYRGFIFTASMYVAASTLIGFEMRVVILGDATIWPVGAPLLVVGICASVLIRRRIRGGNTMESRTDPRVTPCTE